MTSTTPAIRTRSRAPSAFTIVELLVVIGILLVLIATFAGAAALVFARSAKNTAVEIQLRNISVGIEQFRNDLGYLPPLLSDDRDEMDDDRLRLRVVGLASGSIDDPYEDLRDARYHSVMSLPVYLVGIGDVNGDTRDTPIDDPALVVLDDGVEGPGIRNPGPDRSWGGARDRSQHNAPRTGRVYGPYIDVDASNEIVREAQSTDFRRGTTQDISQVGDVFVLQDLWGQPIRYYRDWPIRDDVTGEYSFADVPLELLDLESFRVNANLGVSADRPLLTGEYALLSSGQDRKFGESFEEAGGGTRTVNQNWLWGSDFGIGGEDGYGLPPEFSDVINPKDIERAVDNNIRVTSQ